MARERKQQFLSKAQQAHHRFLVPKTESNDWSNKNGMYGKLSIPALLTGTQSSRRDSNSTQMRRHIRYSPLSRALYPKDEHNGDTFNPVEVQILDMLAVEAEKEFGWKYPPETIRT